MSILSGHSESILSVDASPDGQFIATASKDKTVRCVLLRMSFLMSARCLLANRILMGVYCVSQCSRVWSVPLNKCVGICEGHTMAVGGVAWPKRAKTFHEAQSPWLISASKDKTIKVHSTCVEVVLK